jgi:RND family efflux transporter MFP subunit
MLKRSLIVLVVVGLLVGSGYYVLGWLQKTVKVEPPQMVSVRRDMFVHEILGRGSVDSAQNTEIRVRVESARMGGLTIVYVVPEGTLVKTGDLLVELDSAWLREQTDRQQVTVIASESRLTQSKSDLETAKLTLTEYIDGTFVQQMKTNENEIFAAEEAVRTQEYQFVFVKRQRERGYVTESQVEAALFEYDKAVNTLELAENKLEVLKTFTKEKMVSQYKAAIESAEAKVKGDEKTLGIDTARWEHLKTQLSNCKIYAPSDGQVVYFMPRWGGENDLIREGKGVNDKEILLLLPDPSQMQVKGLVNEANVRFVRPGQKASIRLEAFLNEIYEGEVTDVKQYAESAGWGGQAMSREYLTTVKILNSPEGVRTGLTAEVRITVNEIPSALLLPKLAVLTHGGKTYAITHKEGKWDKVEVTVGPANDKEVVILEGLGEGDEVVLGAWIHRENVDLPKIEEEVRETADPDEEEMLREQIPQMQQQSGGEGQRSGGDRRGSSGESSGGGGPSGSTSSSGSGPGGGGGTRPGGGGGPR